MHDESSRKTCTHSWNWKDDRDFQGTKSSPKTRSYKHVRSPQRNHFGSIQITYLSPICHLATTAKGSDFGTRCSGPIIASWN